MQAVKAAHKEFKVTGYAAVGGKTQKGKAVYVKANATHAEAPFAGGSACPGAPGCAVYHLAPLVSVPVQCDIIHATKPVQIERVPHVGSSRGL